MANDTTLLKLADIDSGQLNTINKTDSVHNENLCLQEMSGTLILHNDAIQKNTMINLSITLSIMSILLGISILVNVLLFMSKRKVKKAQKTKDVQKELNSKTDKLTIDSQNTLSTQTSDTKSSQSAIDAKEETADGGLHGAQESKYNQRNEEKSRPNDTDKLPDSIQSTILSEILDGRSKVSDRIRVYTNKATSRLSLYGMSIQGKGHINDNTPCQDFHHIEIIDANNNIGIAAVSDGAGSAKNSAIGSELICKNSIKYLNMAIKKFRWIDINNLPTEEMWQKVIREVVRLVQVDLNLKAKEMECDVRSLAGTFILLFFTPQKSYFAHVGDGRAAVKTTDGWQAILTPHKGEEANQTVFITNEILNPSNLKISGVSVPETVVINSPIKAYILMSDGCEDGLWIKNRKEILNDGDFRYIPLNKPFEPAIETLVQVLQDKRYTDKTEDVLFQFIDRYNDNLKLEIDDKTIVLGFLPY